jgi:hypothetical protein
VGETPLELLSDGVVVELLHGVRSNRGLRERARPGWSGSSDGDGDHRKVCGGHVKIGGVPGGRSRFSDARKVPS